MSGHDELAQVLTHDVDGCFERLVLAYQDRLYAFALLEAEGLETHALEAFAGSGAATSAATRPASTASRPAATRDGSPTATAFRCAPPPRRRRRATARARYAGRPSPRDAGRPGCRA